MGVVSETDCAAHCPHVDHPPAPRSLTDSQSPTIVAIESTRVAVGVITAPRPHSTLAETLCSLRRAGFPQRILVFADPLTSVTLFL